MLFNLHNDTIDSEKFNNKQFNYWINQLELEMRAIEKQIADNDILIESNSPNRGSRWVHAVKQRFSYLKKVRGGLINQMQNDIHDAPASNSQIARVFMYIANERLAPDVYKLIYEEAEYIANEAKHKDNNSS